MKTLCSLLTLLAFLLLTSPAWGTPSDQLLRHVPSSSPLVLGFEMPKLRSSYLFSEAMKFLKARSKESGVLNFVFSKKAFDVDKDIESFVISFESTPTNPASPAPATMAVVAGKFDPAKVRAAFESQWGKVSSRKSGGLEIFSANGVDFAFVDESTLIFAEGKFAAPTWKAVADEKNSALSNAALQTIVNQTDTTRGLWLALNTKGVKPPEGGRPMDGAGISVDLRGGLRMNVKSHFSNAADAAAAKTDFEESRATAGTDPLVEMLGAQAIVQNMQAVVSDRVLEMKTTMTDAEVKTMLAKLKKMNEAPPPVTPTQKGNLPTPQPVTPGKGADADFN